MRKRSLAAMLLGLALALPAAAEMELGFGLTPIPNDAASQPAGQNSGLWANSFKTFHAGLRTLGVLYVSADLIVVPPNVTEGMTSRYDPDTGQVLQGINRPAVIQVYDAGLKLMLGNLSLAFQGGINQFYIYHQSDIGNFDPPNIGANLRATAGYKLASFLGAEVGVISVQPSLEEAAGNLRGLFSPDPTARQGAIDKLTRQLVPSLQLVLYF